MELPCRSKKKKKLYLGTQVYNQGIPYCGRRDTNHYRHLHHHHQYHHHHNYRLYEVSLYIPTPSVRVEFVVRIFIVSLIQYLALYQ